MRNIKFWAPYVAIMVAGFASPVAAQSSPAQVVSTEVAAFNAHDAKTVANFHSPKAELVVFKTRKVLAQGRVAIAKFFTHEFQTNRHEHATLIKQIVMKNMVVNRYVVTGAGSLTGLISVYDVENNLIANEWLIVP